MAKDDFDDFEPQDDDSSERETEVTSPPERLIQESRRNTAVSKREDLAGAPTESDPHYRKSPAPRPEIPSLTPSRPAVGPRAKGAPASSPKAGNVVLIIGIALAAFLIGFVPSNIYFNSEKSVLKTEIMSTLERLGMCGVNAEKSVDALSECVRDFEVLSGSTAPLGLAPKDYLVEKKRAKRNATFAALSKKQDQILNHLDAMKKPQARSRKRWKELQNDSVVFRTLIDASTRAEQEYQSALRTTITPTAGAADAKMIKRNKERAAYVEEAKDILAAPGWDRATPTP
ncbi:MAG: hypothetical protein GY762_01755 [Proteobacteria bacterium]|nr:hypothetical protein [Pseudomonadota bacterium]